MQNTKTLLLSIILFFALLSGGCSSASQTLEPTNPPTQQVVISQTPEPTTLPTQQAAASQTSEPTISPTQKIEATQPAEQPTIETDNKAHVLSVNASGKANAYQFSVEISSPDLGCEQYADWWEVIDEDGNLLYRRILAHSHVSEQPFTRSGGPIAIDADSIVWVRAHMHPQGYGGAALKGSVNSGFQPTEFPEGFASGLDQTPPLPGGCAF